MLRRLVLIFKRLGLLNIALQHHHARWMPKGIILFVLISMMMLIGSGCNARSASLITGGHLANDRATKVLRVGVATFPKTLDPMWMSPDTWQWADALYDGLAKLDPENGGIKPALAKSWKISADGLQYTFLLRNDVKFGNGKVLNANDVKFSLERVFSPPSPPELAYYLQDITGASERLSGKSIDVVGIKVINDYAVEINLNVPNNELLNLLTHPAASIVNPFVVTANPDYGAPGTFDQPAGQISGTGPFGMVEFVNNMQITLEANSHYYDGKPQVNRIEGYRQQDEAEGFLDLQSGNIDLLEGVTQPDRFMELDQGNFLKIASKVQMPGNFYYLGFNTSKKPLDQIPLRVALAQALQQEKLALKLDGSTPLAGLAPKGWPGEGFPDREHRESLQQTVNVAVYGQEQPFALTLSFTPEAPVGFLVEDVKQQLAQLGIEIKLQQVRDNGELRNLLQSGETDLYIYQWDNSINGPFGYLYSQFHSQPLGVRNLSAYNNSLVDTFLDLGKAEAEPENKNAAYKQAADILAADMPATGLVRTPLTAFARPGLRGLILDPRGFLLMDRIWLLQN